MNNTTTFLIEDLTLLKGKPADHVTHFIKSCSERSDGTMADGLINIVSMLNADKAYCVRKARLGGIVIGTLGSVVIGGGAYLIHMHYEKSQNRKKMQEVAKILKQEVVLANEEELPVNEREIFTED